MSFRWFVTRLEEDAASEVAFLFQNDNVKDEVERILKLLASQDDPRKPSDSSGLIVDGIENDAPGWFRVKVPRYGIRIIFRVLVIRGRHTIDLGSGELEADDRGTIDIIQAV